MEPTLEQKVRDLVAALKQPKKEVSAAQLCLLIAGIYADIDGATDLDPAVIAALPGETRLLILQVFLGAAAQSLVR